MKEALAIGADEAVIVADPALDEADQAGVALVLARAIEKSGPFDLVLFGEGSTDGYSGQVPSRVAELLGLPEIGYARAVAVGRRQLARRAQHGRSAWRPSRRRCRRRHRGERDQRAAHSLADEHHEGRQEAGRRARASPTSVSTPRPWRRCGWCARNLAEEQARKHVMLSGEPAEQAEALVNALVAEGVLGR